MRKLLSISTFVFLFFLTTQTTLTSCTKTNTVYDTVTVTHTDTLQKKDTALTIDILTANSWKALEDIAQVGNTPLYYLRGGSGNTLNLDNEFITFSTDHTGVYTDNNGFTSTFTWNFTDATNTSMTWTWNLTHPSILVTWKHIYYKDAALHYEEYYSTGGINTLGTEVRVAK